MDIIELREVKVPFWLYFSIIASINFWSLSYFDLKVYQYIHLMIFVFLLYNFYAFRRNFSNDIYSRFCILMAFMPLLSILPALLLHNQSIIDSIVVHRMHLGWLIFFALFMYDIEEEQLHKAIIIVGLAVALIMIVQQFTYPYAPFGERTVGTAYTEKFDSGVEKRLGLYRFAVSGVKYLLLTFFLCISKYNNVKWFIYIILVLGILATGTRITWMSVAIGTSYCFFNKLGGDKKLIFIFMALIFALIVYTLWDQLFGNLGNINDDLEYGRMHSYVFYVNEYLRSPLSILFGNGLGRGTAEGYDLYNDEGQTVVLADIGIFANLYYWGALFVLVFICYLLRLLFNKYLDDSYKAFILASLSSYGIQLPIWEFSSTLMWGIIIYMSYLNISKNQNILSCSEK